MKEGVLADLQVYESGGALAVTNGRESAWLPPADVGGAWLRKVFYDPSRLGALWF